MPLGKMRDSYTKKQPPYTTVAYKVAVSVAFGEARQTATGGAFSHRRSSA